MRLGRCYVRARLVPHSHRRELKLPRLKEDATVGPISTSGVRSLTSLSPQCRYASPWFNDDIAEALKEY